MISCRNKILSALLMLSGLIPANGQQSIIFNAEEFNLGKKVEIPVLSPSIRNAVIKEGFTIAASDKEGIYLLEIKASTRQGSETQGIFTSFADISIKLKDKDGSTVSENTFIGLKGAGLSYDHAGIDALKKSVSKVVPEITIFLGQTRDAQPADSDNKIQSITAATDRNLDKSAPDIEISEPLLFRNTVVETTKSSITIEGRASDAGGIVKFTINKAPVVLSSSGRFSTDLPVNEGITMVLIEAEDYNHNLSSKSFSVSRSTGGIKVNAETTELTSGSGKYYAILIGINDYDDPGITSLDNPVNDATALYETITEYYTFEKANVVFLKNPGRDEIIIALDELSKKISGKDNLLIFYAGHGLWDTKKRLGYWLPADAKVSNTANWILNSTIKDIVASMQARHTLLIADACFSGSIFKTRKAFSDAPPSIEKLYELTSRKAMTSGTMTEVPDVSVFLEYLNKRLRENNQPYLSSEQLFTSFREAVMNNSPITPQYGIIQETGDEGGDFIFIRKK
jgi:hypothetical protein